MPIHGTTLTDVFTLYTTYIDTSGLGQIVTGPEQANSLLRIYINPASTNEYFLLDYIALTPDIEGEPIEFVGGIRYTALDLNYHPRHLGS
jgi:hypothetical protein